VEVRECGVWRCVECVEVGEHGGGGGGVCSEGKGLKGEHNDPQ